MDKFIVSCEHYGNVVPTPYKGTADGFIPFLRKKFPENYWGVELEVNNKWADREAFPSLVDLLVKSMAGFEKD